MSRLVAEQTQELRRNELQQARDQANNWRNGLALLVGLISTVSVVKGRDSIDGLTTRVQVAIGLLVLGALAAAAAGAWFSLLAAYGLPADEAVPASPVQFLLSAHAKAVTAARHLRVAIVLTYATLVLLAAAIGLTWYAKPAAGNPLIDVMLTPGQRVCGELVSTGDFGLTLQSGQERITIPTAKVDAFSVVGSC